MDVLDGEVEAASARDFDDRRAREVAELFNGGRSVNRPARKPRLAADGKRNSDGSYRAARGDCHVPVVGNAVGSKTGVRAINDAAQSKNPRLVLVIDVAFAAGDRCREDHGSVQSNALRRISKIFCGHIAPSLDSAAAATAIPAASEDRLRAVHGLRGDRAGAQFAHELVKLRSVALTKLGGLRGLRSVEGSHVELSAELIVLALVVVEFELTQLVEDGLGIRGVRGTSGTRLGSKGVLQVLRSRAVLAATGSKLRLDRVHALHRSGLRGKGAFEVGELIARHLLCDASEAGAQGVLHIAKASGDSGGEIAKSGLRSGMVKASVGVGVNHVLTVKQPRELVHAAVAAAKAAESAPTPVAQENEKQNPAPIAAEAEAAVVHAEAAISGSNRHGKRSVFGVHCV